MNTYRISKHEHRSTYAALPFVSWKGEFRFTAKFSRNVLYERGYTDDLNKLCGVSLQVLPIQLSPFKLAAPHHLNSVRIAWRPGKHTDDIQLFGYIYDKGVFSYFFLRTVQPGYVFSYMIALRDGAVVFMDHDGAKARQEASFAQARLNGPHLGYWLYPYFGGDKPAPENMSIKLGYNKL